MGWVAIAIAVFSALLGAVGWLINRRFRRLDSLEDAVFGTHGMRERMYVTNGVLDVKINELRVQMSGVSEEGQLREERILEAIRNNTLVVGSEMREIKLDMREQNKRIDEVMRYATTTVNQR